MASRALEPIRLSAELSIRKNNANIGLMVSRWSKDTHTFVFPWEDGGPTLQDTAVLMRLSTMGLVAFDPSNLSSADARLVDRLRKAYTAAGKCGSRFDREGRVCTPPKSGKTSWGCWLRYFFKNLPPPGTVPLAGQATEFYGKMYDSDLHLAGFLVYWLSFFVIPDFPYEGPNHTVFPLAVSLAWGDFVPLGPLFLGSLFHCLDQVHADTERSLGCYDMVSVIDDAGTFFPQSYAKPVEGALTTSFFSESDRIVDFQTVGAAVGASALSTFAAACPCSLPALCTEGMRSVLYRPDRVARQFGYDQGAPGPAPPLRSYVVSLRRFTRAFAEELSEGYNIVVLPRKDRETFFMANSRLAWRRNLDSFINYIRGLPEIPAFSDVYHRDVSLRSLKARQPGWRGKRSYWAQSSATPVASRGVTIAEPISTVLPPRVTRAKAREQSSSQQQGLQLKRLWKGAPVRAARTPHSEEAPASIASAGSSFRYEGGGGEHTPLSKLKRKRKCEETREEGSDNSIDDTVPINQSFKLPRTTQPSPDGTSVATGKKVVVALDEGEPDGDDSGAWGSDDRDGEEDDDSSTDGSEEDQSDEDDDGEDHSGDDDGGEDLGGDEDENLGNGGDNDDGDGGEGREGGGGDGGNFGGDMAQSVVDEDEEDENVSGLVPRRRIPTEGILSVPDINQLTPEAVVQQPSSQEVIETALNLLDKRVNIPPIGDLTTHFQAHDAAVALANLTSAQVFADLHDDSFISLGILQAGYTAEAVSEDSSLLAGGSALQQQVEASTSREHVAADDYLVVQVVESPVVNEMEELSNEAFFGYYGFTHEAISFLSFVRDLFPYTFFKVRDLYSRTMGRMQLECLYTFLRSVKGMRVCDLGPNQIEEVGLTVQNFDKLGFDIWWVYKELEAAKVMRENEQL
ncbi:hypothetical protein RHGRI_001601 [Rhododendron griersonianum]|uniref:Aminotransferase-like plant mobile domain-containing protein n=1 Tax=Rhododendron griersonianum TaxID=479676 RepID=A0AAV6LKQ2_9ERIC|nr:hypothetical protein RHGRI_001601 [Rhododendron griersonianum]